MTGLVFFLILIVILILLICFILIYNDQSYKRGSILDVIWAIPILDALI